MKADYLRFETSNVSPEKAPESIEEEVLSEGVGATKVSEGVDVFKILEESVRLEEDTKEEEGERVVLASGGILEEETELDEKSEEKVKSEAVKLLREREVDRRKIVEEFKRHNRLNVSPIPFLMRSNEKDLQVRFMDSFVERFEYEVNIPILEALDHLPLYANQVKSLISDNGIINDLDQVRYLNFANDVVENKGSVVFAPNVGFGAHDINVVFGNGAFMWRSRPRKRMRWKNKLGIPIYVLRHPPLPDPPPDPGGLVPLGGHSTNAFGKMAPPWLGGVFDDFEAVYDAAEWIILPHHAGGDGDARSETAPSSGMFSVTRSF